MRRTTKQNTPKDSDSAAGKHGDLEDTIEALRKEKFPHLPKALVAEILRIESDNLDDRHAALAELSEAIEKHLRKEG
jgi:hypothetical protein